MSSTLRLEVPGVPVPETVLPAALNTARRGFGETDPFLPPGSVTVQRVFDLSRAARDAAAGRPASVDVTDGQSVLALETDGGETLFLNPGRLRSAAQWNGVLSEDSLPLEALRSNLPAGRGFGDFLWRRLSVLGVSEDALLALARKKAEEIARSWLGQAVGDVLLHGPSWVGARALAAAVESRLSQTPGLYRWTDGASAATLLAPVTPEALAQDAADGPLLVFIHGTASSTQGSFADLQAGPGEWSALRSAFGRRIFAFEHRTLSESPVENALELARVLPAGAQLRFVTHSRGGLVGDLLCLQSLSADEIDAWNRKPAPGVNAEEIEAVTRRERDLLRDLRAVLEEKRFVRERYVRVASPARGTLLASANFDVFLSALLAVIGTVPGLRASGIYSGVARLVLEIAKRRMDPQVIPGIEAMLPDAPLPSLLARASRDPGLRFSVIAGDIEGGSVWQRLGVLLTDWTFFDRLDNDLVVDTASMYEGLARAGGGCALFDQGPRINHFRYFENPRTRKALSGWLVPPEPDSTDFENLPARNAVSEAETRRLRSRAAAPAVPDGTRPVVFFLPGIMGSHLEIRKSGVKPGDGRKVWFDFIGIAAGQFANLRWTAGPAGLSIEPEGLFEMFYGDLCDHLSATHHVVRFAYDWRKPIQDEAVRLGREVEPVLRLLAGRQPVRLLAHSMGGLVCRALIQARPELWKEIVQHPGGRFVMLGTPNNGSHLMVQHLLGKADVTRNLARLDLRHTLKDLLEVVATLPGALQLLPRPRPQFEDTAATQEDTYFLATQWQAYQGQVRDRWFGDGISAVPSQTLLDRAASLWSQALPDNRAPEPVDRVAYVFGSAPQTPCGLRKPAASNGPGTLEVLVTGEGDGSVTWRSGRLENLAPERHWWIPSSHSDLTRTRAAFAGLVELLETGSTAGDPAGAGLNRGFPPVTRGVSPVVAYEPGPPITPTEPELAAGLLGDARPVIRRRPTARERLAVSVTAGDLCYVQKPVVCGHYPGDPIAGAEDILDREVVHGGLRQRDRLGFYPDAIGTSVAVLVPDRTTSTRSVNRQGALVVGLGEFGTLNSPALAETVRCGVLRLLIHLHEHHHAAAVPPGAEQVGLAPLLLGYNSTTSIGIEDSLAAVIRGVVAANRQFGEAIPESAMRVTNLEFIEVFLDTAISAARALLQIPRRLETELGAAHVTVDPAPEVHLGSGYRQRLADAGTGSGYWPRIIVTDADQTAGADAGGDGIGRTPSVAVAVGSPPAVAAGTAAVAAVSATEEPRFASPVAERIRYLFLSQRAQAQTVVHPRQPRLIEQLVASAIKDTRFDENLGRLFFDLMVPVDFKETARHLERLVLVVDAATANFPWEMMVTDGIPLVTRARVVRQLASSRSRARIMRASGNVALVLGNPSTEGFGRVFPGWPDPEDGLPKLGGAEKEAAVVRDLLVEADYKVDAVEPGADARTVLSALFHAPHRILHIAAHGLFGMRGLDGLLRTGVVLSDGILLTSAEVEQMETVPEVVFLNCCHLGKASSLPRDTGRLAYSLSCELIEMGVRCVIAAGWEVDDEAARLFAETFYRSLALEDKSFGDAVFDARKRILDAMPACNTWGAYQAYGDPAFRLRQGSGPVARSGPRRWVSHLELEEELRQLTARLRQRLSRDAEGPRDAGFAPSALANLVKNAPPGYLARAGVQAVLGEFHAVSGEWKQAIEAFEAALKAPDQTGELSVSTLDRLAGLETMLAARELDLALVETALRRLEVLLGIQPGQVPADVLHANPDRLALYAAALRNRAAILLKRRAEADEIRATTERARDFYRAAAIAGLQAGEAVNPRPTLDYLQMAAIAGFADTAAKDASTALLQSLAMLPSTAPASGDDFESAVFAAELELTRALLAGNLDRMAPVLLGYREAALQMPSAALDWTPVVTRLVLLADLGEGLGAARKLTAALREIARLLGSTEAAAPVAGRTTGVATSSRSGRRRAPAGRRARKAPPQGPRRKARRGRS